MTKTMKLLQVAYEANARGHEDIAQDLAVAAFECEDASETFASEENAAEELSVEQLEKLTSIAADVAEAGYADIASDLVDVITEAAEAKAGVEDNDSTDADADDIDINAILAEAGGDEDDVDDAEAGGKKKKVAEDEEEPPADDADAATSDVADVMDAGSIRRLKNVANKIASVDKGVYRDQAQKIMTAVAKLEEELQA